jgi:CheY-like chemotaxis protein
LILVADDSPTIQRRAQTILEGEGFEVETVANGVAAIKKLPKMQPVLVLADVSMPGKDGYEVCDYVKTSADLHHVPVLLVASDLEPYDELRGEQVGADGIIMKPFAANDLIDMVAKFAALGEAPASSSALPETLVTSPPVTPPEVAPFGYEPEGATGRHEPDFSAPSGGMAFAQPPEMSLTPPEPLPDISLQPSLQAPLPVGAQPLPEPPLAAPPEDLLGGSSEPLLVPTEPFPGFALEGTPESTPVAPEPTPEPIPEAAPESVLVSSESIFETIVAPTPESIVIVPEPTPEPIPEAAPESVLVSPESISATPLEATSEPAADRTLAFGVAAEIAGPMPIDELAPAPPAPEPPPFVEGQRPKPMAATSLDSFSLAEAAAGEVYIAPPEAEAAPTPEAGVVQPGEAPRHPPSVINPEWVMVIVHKVVMKMAPPVLPPDLVRELIRVLTEEITAELNSESSQPY